VLVFQFPSQGHQCYTQGEALKSVSCIHCKGMSNNSGILVKLADLGISAFVGPGGFHRKSATPGHTAPEAIRHMGKEQMTEKVGKLSVVNQVHVVVHHRLTYFHWVCLCMS